MDTELSFEAMVKAVVEGDIAGAGDLARRVLEQGLDPHEAIEQGFAAGINEVGRLWEEGEYFLPELMAGAEAMKAAMAVLTPALQESGAQVSSRGRVTIGTVEGDLHDIGKTLVATMLSASGFEVTDLGADVALDSFVTPVDSGETDMICMSALLTTTMVAQRKVIEELERRDLRKKVKVMVGGAPVTQGWADEIGADGYGPDAVSAVARAREILEAGG